MNLFNNLIRKHGVKLCSLAMCISVLASQSCRARLYEPKEPEGLRDFAGLKKF